MSHAAVMAEIDAYVAEGRGGYRGWHEDNEEGPNYRPMLQQCRAEFSELMYAALGVQKEGSALQIGLGRPGGSHWALKRIFNRVITIDNDAGCGHLYRALNGQVNGRDMIMICDSKDPRFVDDARAYAPFDFLFIDGDHTYAGVRADWQNYRPLVRSGGIIAFHDTYKEQPGCDVPRFIAELEREGQLLHHIRHPDPALAVGISLYYVR